MDYMRIGKIRNYSNVWINVLIINNIHAYAPINLYLNQSKIRA